MMKFWKNLETSNRIAIISSILLPVIFFGLSLWLNFQNKSQIENLNKKINAQTFRPILTLVGGPIITKTWFDPIKIDFEGLRDSVTVNPETGISEIPVRMNLSLKAKLKLSNSGNSIAKIIYSISGTNASDETVLRKLLLEHINKPYKLSTHMMRQYSAVELLPNNQDTTTITIELNVSEIKNNNFGIHYLILYENELGYLYDSYFQTQIGYEELYFDSPVKIEDNKLIITRYKKYKFAITDFLKVRKTRSLYYTYSESDLKKFNAFVKSTKEKIFYKMAIDSLIQINKIFIVDGQHHWTESGDLNIEILLVNSSPEILRGDVRLMNTLSTKGLDREFLSKIDNPLDTENERHEIETFLSKRQDDILQPKIQALYNFYDRGAVPPEGLDFEPTPQPFEVPDRNIAFTKHVIVNPNDSLHLHHTFIIPPDYVGYIHELKIDSFDP